MGPLLTTLDASKSSPTYESTAMSETPASPDQGPAYALSRLMGLQKSVRNGRPTSTSQADDTVPEQSNSSKGTDSLASDTFRTQPTPKQKPCRRVTNALTTQEIQGMALDPSLVPKPLKVRNVSAPANLQNSSSTISTSEPAVTSSPGGTGHAKDVSAQPLSRPLVLLDMVARLFASGVDMTRIAECMDYDLNDLLRQFASSPDAATQDSPQDLDAAIDSMYTWILNSNTAENPGVQADSTPTPSPATKDEDEDLEAEEGDETLVADPTEEPGTNPSEEVENTTKAKLLEPDHSTSLQEVELGYHDAVESQLENLIESDNHVSTFSRQVANLGGVRRREADLRAQRQRQLRQVARRRWLFTRCPVMLKVLGLAAILTGILLGRVLGILASEIQVLVPKHGASLRLLLFFLHGYFLFLAELAGLLFAAGMWWRQSVLLRPRTKRVWWWLLLSSVVTGLMCCWAVPEIFNTAAFWSWLVTRVAAMQFIIAAT